MLENEGGLKRGGLNREITLDAQYYLNKSTLKISHLQYL